MNKFSILFCLFLLSCSIQKNKNYPFNMMERQNYNKLNFKYKIIKSFEYKFCEECVYTGTCEGDYQHNLKEKMVAEFLKENTLKDRQYLTNFKIPEFPSIEKYFIFTTRVCRTVSMDLVEKIDE